MNRFYFMMGKAERTLLALFMRRGFIRRNGFQAAGRAYLDQGNVPPHELARGRNRPAEQSGDQQQVQKKSVCVILHGR